MVSRVANWMPLGLMLERRTCVSCFWDMEPPIGELSGGVDGTGWDPKMEEAVVGLVITEECLGVGWSGVCCDLPGKEE